MFSFSFAKTAKPEPAAPPTPAVVPPPVPVAPAVPNETLTPRSRPSIFSQRSLKQLGLFFGGASFLALSTLITRRAVGRKLVAAFPKFYQPSHRPTAAKSENTEGPFMAVEALNLATLNVLSFFVMLTGGAAWAFDISSLDDLRGMARRHIGPRGPQTDEAAEREVEEWVAKVLSRKEKGGGSSSTSQDTTDG